MENEVGLRGQAHTPLARTQSHDPTRLQRSLGDVVQQRQQDQKESGICEHTAASGILHIYLKRHFQ